MKTAAVIVGINAYTGQLPALTASVNDALAFRDLLLELGLVPAERISLFTAPEVPGSRLATRKAVMDALFDLYADGHDYDRVYVYFSGHGLLTYTDAAQSLTQTVLVPVDVENLDRDGGLLISVDELLGRFKLRGPKEQVFLLDACRNLGWKRHPGVGPLGWAALPALGEARAQAALYAASRLGEALAVPHELGVVTRHILDALRGHGIALDYDDEAEQYVVSIESLRAYVREAAAESLRGIPLAERKLMVPELLRDGPEVGPLRAFDPAAVRRVPFSVHIWPDEAAVVTEVVVTSRGNRLAEYGLPPYQNHDEILLPPQRFKLVAVSHHGSCLPPEQRVDVRREREARFTVAPAGAPMPPPFLEPAPPAGPAATIAAARVEVRGLDAGILRPGMGLLDARAHEPEVTVEIDGQAPPYRRITSQLTIRQEVLPGPYRVRFRLGPDVFCETTVDVEPGQTLTVTPRAEQTPLVREALNLPAATPPTTVISESIGEIQAGVLATMLPIIGVKPFDTQGVIFGQFDGLVQPLHPARFDMHPLSIVVAADGMEWTDPPGIVLDAVRCTVSPLAGYGEDGAAQAGLGDRDVPLERLAPAWMRGALGDFERVRLGVTQAPAGSFQLMIASPHFGTFRLACAAIPGRATVVSVVMRPDGTLDVGQNLLRVPVGYDYDHRRLGPAASYGRVVRDLQLGRKLYESGELVSPNGPTATTSNVLLATLYAKWTDPILGCMGYYAWRRRMYGEGNRAIGDPDILRRTAMNLAAYFGELPDSRVIHALEFGEERFSLLDGLLERDELPVLAESARLLARHARDSYRQNTPVVGVAERIPTDQIWTLYFE